MTDLLERLRALDVRITAQRRAVAEVLSGVDVHLSADEIHERAVRLLPEISLATVYNTLAELVRLGEITEVSLDGRTRRYDPNVDVPHHHLVCDDCGQILDVVAPKTRGDLLPRDRRGFAIDRVEITYRGLCQNCIDA